MQHLSRLLGPALAVFISQNKVHLSFYAIRYGVSFIIQHNMVAITESGEYINTVNSVRTVIFLSVNHRKQVI